MSTSPSITERADIAHVWPVEPVHGTDCTDNARQVRHVGKHLGHTNVHFTEAATLPRLCMYRCRSLLIQDGPGRLVCFLALLLLVNLCGFDFVLLDAWRVRNNLAGRSLMGVHIGHVHHLTVFVCSTVVDSVDPTLVKEDNWEDRERDVSRVKV